MDPVPVGTVIRVKANTNQHAYDIGGTYTVAHVDQSDDTFRASDSSGETRNWLRWCDCESAGPSVWDHLAADLPEDLVMFLSAFDGISSIQLREPVIDAILATLPDLHERIIRVTRSPEGAAMVQRNQPRPIQHGGE